MRIRKICEGANIEVIFDDAYEMDGGQALALVWRNSDDDRLYNPIKYTFGEWKVITETARRAVGVPPFADISDGWTNGTGGPIIHTWTRSTGNDDLPELALTRDEATALFECFVRGDLDLPESLWRN